MQYDGLDPRTPVLVGVGQVSEQLGSPGYRKRSPVQLAADAAREALADSGAATEVTAAIDTVAGVRQFEISAPGMPAPLGRSDNFPRSVAARLGADPRRAILEITGGHSPQHLVNELAGAIAAGRCEVALVFGAEAISTAQALTGAEDRPDWSEQVGGQLEDRGYGMQGLASMHRSAHGLTDAPSQYALLENARRARLKQSRQEYAASVGRLFAPFTKVAAANPHAAAPVERSAAELVTPTGDNRLLADPYTRYVVARDKVNQGAAVLLMSVAAARRLGVPQERWVFLHGRADLRERDLMDRADFGSAPAAVAAARGALDMAGVGVDEVATFDFYSCFPVAVFAVTEGLGLKEDDPRGLTLTGGLPFFGGPGNNYSMHGLAETVHRARSAPGSFGFVGANGGFLSKYSVGVYSTAPAEWKPSNDADLQSELDTVPAPVEAKHADGWATIETFTVKYGRSGDKTGIVIGRLERDGRRFVAMTQPGDTEMLDLLVAEQPIGERVFVRSFGYGNRVTATPQRMEQLLPTPPLVLRESYEHITVRRDGHLLEVAINRPEVRNCLHPMANDELEHAFDCFFADPDLWVAIITGAGEQAFCAGNDLRYSSSGKPMWVPKNGFGGLTHREGMTKPVIAAVNGYTMAGGFEIALACHLIVADATAQFAFTEVRVGLVAGEGGAIRLARALPPKVATEMLLTGRRMGAQEAHRWGLVTEITGPGKALAAAREMAARILEGSPAAIRSTLRLMTETAGITDTVAATRHPSAVLDELFVSEDAIEGMLSFAQKRKPRWVGR
ncbi:acetyl-CoA acetyltransferase [Streptomyces sp. NPDC057253]|uniref:acetyl-CoA acetyltransferase n=1 Tax=Streptomyces sp. NPDC057253 TaxID=3346069 RepID=UPI0036434148